MKDSRLVLLLLGILVVFVLGVVLQTLQSVLLPFLIAVLLSIIFEPVVLFLKKRRVPMALSLLAVLLVLLLIVFLLGLPLFSSTGAFVEALPRYEAKLDRLATDAASWLTATAERMGVALNEIDSSDLFQFSMLTSAVSAGVGSFVTFVGNVFLVVLFMLFMLAGSGELGAKIRHAFPPDSADRIARVLKNSSAQVRQYLVTKTLVSAGTGFLTFLALWILGVDFPMVWGFLAFLLNFIPNVGSLVAVVLPCILSLLQFDTLLQPILVLILLGVVQTVMGNILEPRMMAFSLNLSPLLVLVSLIFWGWLWGLWGMVLAVPLTATIKIILENIEPLRPISVLMSGRVEAPQPPPEAPPPEPETHEAKPLET